MVKQKIKRLIIGTNNKGKIGIFDIKDNKINHRLNLYEIKDGSIKEIF